MKTEQERINSLADFLAEELGRPGCHDLARRALAAADRETLPWPTDVTMERLCLAFTGSDIEWGEPTRQDIKAVLREHDPILQAVLEWFDCWKDGQSQSLGYGTARRLYDAVKKYGLR